MLAKIKKGDRVLIITGKDRAAHKTGIVSRLLPDKNKVVVDGCNMVKKHSSRQGRAGVQGGIAEKPMPIDISNVKLICPECNKATRIYPDMVGGHKVRVCKLCNHAVDHEA